jgi:hypothetical protein
MTVPSIVTDEVEVRESSVCINTCMNYQAAYDRLISYRQEHPAQGYTERHHIIMRSMGGSDDPTNLVVLTGREHWIAHLLLHKIYGTSQTMYACHMMAMRCEERGIPYVRNSRMYEKIRKECAKLCSIRMKVLQSGTGNSQYGTCWICNTELQENKKILKSADIPEGWIYGRNKWRSVKKPKRTAEEHREQCRNINLGKRTAVKKPKKDPTFKSERIKQSNRTRLISDETKEKQRLAKIGKVLSAETKHKISESRKKKSMHFVAV